MDRQRLLQVLDNSACLTNRQIVGYLKHSLFPEELRVVELHLSRCPLCSDALDGLEQYEHQIGDALNHMPMPVLPELSLPEKPRETFQPEKPKTPLSRSYTAKKERSTLSAKRWGRPVGIAAALLLGFGALWYFKFSGQDSGRLVQEVSEPTSDTLIAGMVENKGIQTPPADKISPAMDTLHFQKVAPVDTTTVKTQAETIVAINEKNLADTSLQKPAAAALSEEASVADLAVADKEQEKVAEEPKEVTVVANSKAAKQAAEKERKKEEEVRKEPPATRSQFRIGMEQYKKKEYEQAIGYFKQAEANTADPNHWEAVYYTGMCYKALGKRRKAIRQFKMVAESNHKSLKSSAEKQLEEIK